MDELERIVDKGLVGICAEGPYSSWEQKWILVSQGE